MASVSIESVRKHYGQVPVLRNVSVDIEDGEFLILVGPSGCGKSTLLRMIAGLESITDGTIRIGDRVVNDVPPKARDIAMVFQSYALYPHMTVAQNMGFSLKLARRPKEEIDAAVNKAAEILNLGELLNRTPKQLSGGQRQRVAMGRAIVRNPAVFLFDEPLSNLDAKLRVQMRSEIKKLHDRLGTTIIYVTHDQIEAMTMADRIVVMQGGVIEQAGAPLELYDKPTNLFVAGFIGSPAINLIEGKASGPERFVSTDGSSFRIAGASMDAGAKLMLGVRPEHFEVVEAGTPDALGGTVVVVEPTGSETQVILSIGHAEILVLLHERIDAQPGQIIHIRPMAGRVHLFDGSSGLRVN